MELDFFFFFLGGGSGAVEPPLGTPAWITPTPRVKFGCSGATVCAYVEVPPLEKLKRPWDLKTR